MQHWINGVMLDHEHFVKIIQQKSRHSAAFEEFNEICLTS
tara:strand:- start:675 stop:794 length:120 start_codon:yes stop_codon:yes gene_type:complete